MTRKRPTNQILMLQIGFAHKRLYLSHSSHCTSFAQQLIISLFRSQLVRASLICDRTACTQRTHIQSKTFDCIVNEIDELSWNEHLLRLHESQTHLSRSNVLRIYFDFFVVCYREIHTVMVMGSKQGRNKKKYDSNLDWYETTLNGMFVYCTCHTDARHSRGMWSAIEGAAIKSCKQIAVSHHNSHFRSTSCDFRWFSFSFLFIKFNEVLLGGRVM